MYFLFALKPKSVCFLFKFNLVEFARSGRTALSGWENLRRGDRRGGSRLDVPLGPSWVFH